MSMRRRVMQQHGKCPGTTTRPSAVLAAVAVVSSMLLAGCSNAAEPAPPVAAPPPSPAETETAATATPTENPTVTPPVVVDNIWPLTGEPIADASNRPALLLKVEGSVMARPQAGLEDADHVYEVVVEGGITRFVAVYDSQIPDVVLPIRSARGSDIGIVEPYGGVFGFSGANALALQRIRDSGIQSLTFDAGNAGFRRVADRRAPHNVAGDTSVLLGQANATRAIPVPGNQRFAADAAASSMAGGQPVSRLSARMSNIQTTNWDWNAATGVFLRSDGASPSMTVAGTQMSADNVVLLSVEMTTVEGLPEVVLTGTGNAVYAADGRYIEGTWAKGGDALPFRFLDSTGAEVQFAPGTTWFQLVPTTSSWTIN